MNTRRYIIDVRIAGMINKNKIFIIVFMVFHLRIIQQCFRQWLTGGKAKRHYTNHIKFNSVMILASGQY